MCRRPVGRGVEADAVAVVPDVVELDAVVADVWVVVGVVAGSGLGQEGTLLAPLFSPPQRTVDRLAVEVMAASPWATRTRFVTETGCACVAEDTVLLMAA